MAKEYLEQLTTLMAEIAPREFEKAPLDLKHFFSGAAVYADGRICITWTPAGLALKLPPESRDVLIQEHGAGELRYFPNAPVKKDYVVLPTSLMENPAALRQWIETSIEYVLTLPKPARRGKK